MNPSASWPLAFVTESCEFDKVVLKKEEIVYAISLTNLDDLHFMQLKPFIKPQTKHFDEYYGNFKRAQTLSKQKDSKEVAIVTSSMKLVFLPKEYIREMTNTEWEAIAMSLLICNHQRINNSITSLTFYLNISPIFSKILLEVFCKLVSTMKVDHSQDSFCKAEANRFILTNIFYNLNSYLNAKSYPLTGRGANVQDALFRNTVQEEIAILTKALDIFEADFKKNPLLFVDGDAIQIYMNVSSLWKEISWIFMENSRRNGAATMVKQFFKQYYEEENYVLNKSSETMAPSIGLSKSKIVLLAALNFLRDESKDTFEIYLLAFTQIIHLHPILSLPFEEEEFNTKFIEYFDQIVAEKELNIKWEEAMNDPRILYYLEDYYMDRRHTYNCFLFKELALCTLTYRLFGEMKFQIQCQPEPDLKAQIIQLLAEGYDMRLAAQVTSLIGNDEAKVELFMEILIEVGRNIETKSSLMKIFHTGACWHVLIKCLEQSEEFRKMFSKYKETVCNQFCSLQNSTINNSTLLYYFSKLKRYFEKDESNSSYLLGLIEKALENRVTAQDLFTQYFVGLTDQKMTTKFKEALANLPFCFFGMVTSQILGLIYNRNKIVDIEKKIELFIEALNESPVLRKSFYESGIQEQMGKTLRQTTMLIPEKPFENLFTLSWAEFHAGEIAKKATIPCYDLSELKFEAEFVGEGGHGMAKPAKIPSCPFPVIAKIFKNTQEISKELDYLMKMQGHPHVVQIYGYIVDKGNYHGILMEYCKGGDLHNVVKDAEEAIDEIKILNWSIQAVSGLVYLHKNKVIHRDVKLQNMVLDSQKEILKITDMGITKSLIFPKGHRVETKNQIVRHVGGLVQGLGSDIDKYIMEALTNISLQLKQPSTFNPMQNNEIISILSQQYKENIISHPGVTLTNDQHTSGYSAPELDTEENETKIKQAYDVFSMGRSIWHMVYRRFPTNEEVEATMNEILPSGGLAPVEITENLKTLMIQMMKENPEDRPTMQKVYEELKKFLAV